MASGGVSGETNERGPGPRARRVVVGSDEREGPMAQGSGPIGSGPGPREPSGSKGPGPWDQCTIGPMVSGP